MEKETWTAMRKDGRQVTFTYRETGQDQAEMTAKVEGDEFTQLLKKSGLELPLSHGDVESEFREVQTHRTDHRVN